MPVDHFRFQRSPRLKQHGAYASFEEDIKGSLTPGKLADFVLLAADPHHTDPYAIKNIQVVATSMGGKATFDA